MNRLSIPLACCLALLAVGCDDEPLQVGRGNTTTPTPPVYDTAVPGEEGDRVGAADAGHQIPTFRDEDFVEADTNRDPFRNYAAMFQAAAPELTNRGGGRDIVMSDTSIDEMRVIGIISGVSSPRAMIVDREGVGHTVSRGQYVGRSEVVQAGGTEELPVTLNWRVDRIRPGEVVLTRDDPTALNRPPLTRVLPLRDEDETQALSGIRRVAGTDPRTR